MDEDLRWRGYVVILGWSRLELRFDFFRVGVLFWEGKNLNKKKFVGKSLFLVKSRGVIEIVFFW